MLSEETVAALGRREIHDDGKRLTRERERAKKKQYQNEVISGERPIDLVQLGRRTELLDGSRSGGSGHGAADDVCSYVAQEMVRNTTSTVRELFFLCFYFFCLRLLSSFFESSQTLPFFF
jgi:hypothetical protein